MYPALAVLQALKSEVTDMLWVGSQGGMEAELVSRAGVPFTSIPAAGVHGVGLRALPGNLAQLGRGWLVARRVLRQATPDVLFFTGGYVAVPVALAGRRLPTLLFVPDIEPGLALKFLARFADHIAVPAEESLQFFPDPTRVTVTGYPTRQNLVPRSPSQARRKLGLEPGLETLLAFGGSKGARSINRALTAALPELLPHMQVVHISGQLDWPEVQRKAETLPSALRRRYHPWPYLHTEMGDALASADLVVARAGASTLGEFPLFGLPAVLVPYPHAWRYQQVNAHYLAQRGAAMVVDDRELAARLAPTVLEIMGDSQRRETMRAAMRSLARPQAAMEIARLVVSLASGAES